VEEVGRELAEIIPAGSKVYWEAENAASLLNAPGIQIYSPQIYALFSFRLDGDPDLLLRHGLWNESLARQWRQEADFIVTEVNWFEVHRPGGDLDIQGYEEFQTQPVNPCDPNSYLLIYQRNP
jgi:hypothetical protein